MNPITSIENIEENPQQISIAELTTSPPETGDPFEIYHETSPATIQLKNCSSEVITKSLQILNKEPAIFLKENPLPEVYQKIDTVQFQAKEFLLNIFEQYKTGNLLGKKLPPSIQTIISDFNKQQETMPSKAKRNRRNLKQSKSHFEEPGNPKNKKQQRTDPLNNKTIEEHLETLREESSSNFNPSTSTGTQSGNKTTGSQELLEKGVKQSSKGVEAHKFVRNPNFENSSESEDQDPLDDNVPDSRNRLPKSSKKKKDKLSTNRSKKEGKTPIDEEDKMKSLPSSSQQSPRPGPSSEKYPSHIFDSEDSETGSEPDPDLVNKLLQLRGDVPSDQSKENLREEGVSNLFVKNLIENDEFLKFIFDQFEEVTRLFDSKFQNLELKNRKEKERIKKQLSDLTKSNDELHQTVQQLEKRINQLETVVKSKKVLMSQIEPPSVLEELNPNSIKASTLPRPKQNKKRELEHSDSNYLKAKPSFIRDRYKYKTQESYPEEETEDFFSLIETCKIRTTRQEDKVTKVSAKYVEMIESSEEDEEEIREESFSDEEVQENQEIREMRLIADRVQKVIDTLYPEGEEMNMKKVKKGLKAFYKVADSEAKKYMDDEENYDLLLTYLINQNRA